MTENQKKALAIKGDHRIYFGRDINCPEGIFAEIADLDQCELPDPNGSGFYGIPLDTPDWLYDVLEVLGCGVTFDESMESVFEFNDLSIMEEVREICDVIVEL